MMKKKLLFLLIPLLIAGTVGCVKYNGKGKNRGKTSAPTSQESSIAPDSSNGGGNSSAGDNSSSQKPIPTPTSDELPVGTDVKVYLVFGEYGLYKDEAVNNKIESLFLEHAIELEAKVGDRLPTRDDVKSTVEGSKFVAWTAYNNDGKLTEYTKVPGYQNKILYASFAGGNGSDSSGGGSQGGGEQGGGGQPVDPTTLTYTVTGLPDWIQDDGCVIFAWVWGPSDGGSWKSLSYGSNHDASFTVGDALNGFLLARCKAGTTQPNWDEHGENVGRVYNKTNDIACSSGVYSYACADWVDYN